MNCLENENEKNKRNKGCRGPPYALNLWKKKRKKKVGDHHIMEV